MARSTTHIPNEGGGVRRTMNGREAEQAKLVMVWQLAVEIDCRWAGRFGSTGESSIEIPGL